MRWLIRYGIGLFLWLPGNLTAQRVLYTNSFRSFPDTRFQFIGKSGNYYWIEKEQKQKNKTPKVQPGFQSLQSFLMLDSKLNRLIEYPAVRLEETIKQWLVCAKEHLDQVIITQSAGKTILQDVQFSINESESPVLKRIDSLPFQADPSDLLLVRSEDHSKILFIAFENTRDELTRVHTLLFDSDWNPLYHEIISHTQFAQPCIQDDEIGFPGENFDDLPVKLANNGEWLMVSPSRISRNFSIFHTSANGRQYYFREVPLSPFYKMEDIAMTIDNGGQEMSVGLLSAYSNTTLKNVQVFNYSMKKGKFDFDSSFHFNTRYRDIRNSNLSHQRFYAIPGAGYLYMIEYGREADPGRSSVPALNFWEASYLMSNYTEIKSGTNLPENGYSVHSGLSPVPIIKNRGDLNIFYFPAIPKDSVWTGILDTEQHPDANNPGLSYLFIPSGDKLFMIYNHFDQSPDALATATTLHTNGRPSEEPLVFWEMEKKLNFQQARRFSGDEVAVPYTENRQTGFAVIKLK